MHDSAFRIGELVMGTYSDLPNAKILEIGSLNVNGCLRDAAASTTQYTGLDLEKGPSVDHVIVPGSDFPVEDDSFDLVMASSVFEHDARFWDTFVRMCRAARPGGHIYVNAPSNGTVHRYPMDCWRFYPDAGLALAEHARLQGLEIDLVESFIGNRHSDVWNDFVAVFRKGPSAEPLNTAFVYYRYPSLNARTWQSRAVYNESDSTEDMQLINELRQRCESLSDPAAEDARIAQLDEARTVLAAEQEQRAVLAEEVARLSTALAETERNGSSAVADNAYLAAQIATLESNLREAQEEIEQTWARANELTGERDAQLEEARGALDAEREKHAALAEEMARLSAALAEAEQNGNRAVVDNEHLAGQIATLESNLRQRQEEIEQAWARANELTGERDQLYGQIEELQKAQERLQIRLQEADRWVFDIAGERQALQKRLAAVQSELEHARRAIIRMEAVSEFKQQQLDEHVSTNRLILAGVSRLKGLEIEPSELLQAQTKRLREEWRDEKHPLAPLAEILEQVAHSISERNIAGEGNPATIAALLEQKAALHRDIEMLMDRLEQREDYARQTEGQIAALNQTLASVRADALEYHGKASQALEQLNILQSENKQQARDLRAAEDRAGRKERQLDWMRRLYRLIESGNIGLKGMLPPSMRRRRARQMLQSNNLFDGEAYLGKYADVAEAGMDPLHHYILHGMAEGRFVDSQSQG